MINRFVSVMMVVSYVLQSNGVSRHPLDVPGPNSKRRRRDESRNNIRVTILRNQPPCRAELLENYLDCQRI